jgi:MEDS: MEthanogen/methylotroph, DcmR Sensory domain
MACLERNRLEREHAEAGGKFDAARQRLQARIGTSKKEEFESLNRAVDQSWQVLARARIALDLHVRAHGCEAAQEARASNPRNLKETTNPTATEILTNPHPAGHIVYPYTDETHIADAVSLFASAGLRKGEGVLLIMASIHCSPIRQRLESLGFNLAELEASGKLVCEDAADLLSLFVFDGIVDEFKFKNTLIGMIEKAKIGEDGRARPVRVFGEMVDLLWKTDHQTTQRLEELWNEVIEAQSVPLLCAYSLAGTKPSDFPQALIACHSHAIS